METNPFDGMNYFGTKIVDNTIMMIWDL